MNRILILAPLAVALITVIYGLIRLFRAGKANIANKKLFDAGKTVENSIRSYVNREFGVFGVAIAILFVIVLYLLGWKIGIAFLIGGAIAGAISHASALLIAKSHACTVDIARGDQIKSANTILSVSGASSLFAIGSALLSSIVLYAIFKDVAILIALSLGALLIELISKLNGNSKGDIVTKNEHNHSAAGPIGVVVATLAVGSYFATSAYPGNDSVAYLPFLLLGSGILAMLIGTLITRVKKSGIILNLILGSNFIPAILLLAGSYFLINWTITGEGAKSPLHVFIAFAIGVVMPLILLAKGYWINEKMKLDEANSKLMFNIILTLLTLASILGVYYLAGYFGIAVATIGVAIYLIPVMSLSRAIATFENSEAVMALAGVDTDVSAAKAVYENTRKLRGYLGTYPHLLGIMASVAVLFLFFQRISDSISTVSFSLNDPYMIAGIVLGGLISYYFATNIEGKVKHGLIIPLSVMFILVTALGIFLGLPIVLGALVGAMLASVIFAIKDGLVTTTIASITLTAISILFIPILKLDYSVKAKSIIGIALIVLILIYIVLSRMKKDAK